MSATHYSVHIHNDSVKGKVYDLHTGSTSTDAYVRLEMEDAKSKADHHIVIFISSDRMWELSHLFTDIGQSLAALAPAEKETE